jgi:hypothetical protein
LRGTNGERTNPCYADQRAGLKLDVCCCTINRSKKSAINIVYQNPATRCRNGASAGVDEAATGNVQLAGAANGDRPGIGQ